MGFYENAVKMMLGTARKSKDDKFGKGAFKSIDADSSRKSTGKKKKKPLDKKPVESKKPIAPIKPGNAKPVNPIAPIKKPGNAIAPVNKKKK